MLVSKTKDVGSIPTFSAQQSWLVGSVAQLASVSVLGTDGQGFESPHFLGGILWGIAKWQGNGFWYHDPWFESRYPKNGWIPFYAYFCLFNNLLYTKDWLLLMLLAV